MKRRSSGEYRIERRVKPSADWRRLAGFHPRHDLRASELAERRYAREREKVRRGELRLVAPNGAALFYYSAPRVVSLRGTP